MSVNAKPSQPQQEAVDFDPFAGPALLHTAPSTEPQREIWTASRMGQEASLAFNESGVLTLRGELQVEALRAAIGQLVARHDALRSTLSADGLQLYVAAPPEVEVPLIDLTDLPAPERAERLQRLLEGEVAEPFDLEWGPLIRFKIVRLDVAEHRLVITAHHIVCDGWSTAVLLRDLGALYGGRLGADATLEPLETFTDYARAQAEDAGSPQLLEAEEYWLKQFSKTVPVLELPTDRPRRPVRTFDSRRLDHTLDEQLIKPLKATAAKKGASFFTALLAGFKALLARLTGQQDIVVGIPAAGQSVGGHANLVGHCVNTLPLRSQVAAEDSFADLTRSLRTTVLDAMENQSFTYGALLRQLPIERDMSRLPLVSVLFNVDQALTAEQMEFPGLEACFASNARLYENFDLFVNGVEENNQVVLEVQYNTQLFDEATVRRWMVCYETLLRGAIADPEVEIGSLPILPDSALQQLAAWNDTAADYPKDLCLHQLIEAVAARTPEAPALVFEDQTLTYAQLDSRAGEVAARLRARGVTRGSLVGLYLDRSPEMVVALLGVLKAGGAYVPLDPKFPTRRLAFMVQDSGMQVLVTETALRGTLPTDTPQTIWVDAPDDGADGAGQDSPAPAADDVRPADTAYVIYTSGSTGKPKGVMVPHRAVVNFVTSVATTPGLDASDNLVAVTTLSFDISVLELIAPLTVGARVTIASRETAGDSAALLELLERSDATVMQATPATWRMLFAVGWRGGPSFKAICGGEALPLDLARQLVEAAGSVWNMYGPTEATVWSTCQQLKGPVERVAIGRPLSNQRIHILDERLQPVPVGVPGELCIAGEGVTDGYLGRPTLTAERFLPDPDHPGARLYRTGDQARFLHDGELEFLGRNDNQVKVRGFRIELGEIETILARHDAVGQAVVTVREFQAGDARLVAYLIPASGELPPEEELRSFLRISLPDYMVPQHFVSLSAFPLTPNEKIDRDALPAPAADRPPTAEYVEPRTDTERQVATLWQEALGVARASIHDNFFRVGGHSLLVAQITARLSRDRGVTVPMRALFENPTIAQLAAWLDAAPDAGQQEPTAGVVRRDDQQRAPLSLMQQRLWFLEQLDPGKGTFNLPSGHRLTGELQLPAFLQAFKELIRRQAALRTVIRMEGETPVQWVQSSMDDELPFEDLSHLAPADRQARIDEFFDRDTARPFDLEQGPLFRAQLFRLGQREHVFSFNAHHIIWDGWSFDLFYEQFSAIYSKLRRQQDPPPDQLPVSYGDFAAWHRDWLVGQELERQVSFWKEHLADSLAPLELPTDHPRPPIASGNGATEWVDFDPGLVEALEAVGQRSGATGFMTILAAFAVLIHRHTNRTNIVVGTPVRGRSRPELEDIMGFFVNALPLRIDVDPEQSFLELLTNTRERVLSAFENQDVPFERLVQDLNVPRDMSRFPLYQVFFSWQDVRNRVTVWDNLEHSRIEVHAPHAAQDINFWFARSAGGLGGGLNYNTDLFEQDTILRIRDQFNVLLGGIAADPQQKLRDLPLLTDAVVSQLEAWNETRAEYPQERCLHQLVAEQAGRSPQQTAVELGDQRLSYAELDARANQLARHLRGRGIGRGCRVGIYLERGLEMIIALQGVLRAGAAYVPLDPAFPGQRIAYMARDAALELVITRARVAPQELEGVPALLLDDDDDVGREPTEALPPGDQDADAESPAYVIYTSGSTGKPKGVQVGHRALTNFVTSMAHRPGMGPADRVVGLTTLAFDISALELHVPLTVGATVVLVDRDTAADGLALRDWLQAARPSLMQATPATWRLLFESGWSGDPDLRILCGGEALPLELAQKLLERCPEVWNMYGPTETTVWSACQRLEQPLESVTVGKPINNTQVWILDDRGALVPTGVPGEICIGGDGVAMGYLGLPELTAERFFASPFSDGPVYRTGDMGRWCADGTLECLGRQDDQVKVRGFRIELGEIEASLLAQPGVRAAAAAARPGPAGDKRVVAYVVPDEGAAVASGKLRRALRQSLPDYMVPSLFVTLESLPLTPNGKLDRKALPDPDRVRSEEVAYSAPRTDNEKVLAEMWRSILEISRVGRQDNFFDLGGHSLLAAVFVHRAEQKLGARIGLRELMFHTLEQLARSMPTTAPEPTTHRAPPTPPASGGRKGGMLGRLKNALKRRD